MPREGPVLASVLKSVPGRDGVTREVDFDDAVDYIAAGESREAAVSQRTLYLRDIDQSNERVIKNGKDAKHGEGHANVGDNVRCRVPAVGHAAFLLRGRWEKGQRGEQTVWSDWPHNPS